MSAVKKSIKGLTPQGQSKTGNLAVYQITGRAKMYFVESLDKKVAYKVKWDGKKGVCTCDDYQYQPKGKGFICSHIKAVRDSKDKMSVLAQQSVKKTDDQIYKELTKDFPEELILVRPDGLKTIACRHIIDRLNSALGILNWSFRHSTPICHKGEYSCNGRIDINVNGRTSFRQQTGSCKIDTGNGVKLTAGEAQTGAIQMTLKKCASLFGCGLHQIYGS